MQVILLDDSDRRMDQHGDAIPYPGTLHAARPGGPGSELPEAFTLCGRPTVSMDVLGPREPGPGTPLYPPNLEGKGPGKAAGCGICARRVFE
ncbi:hypothetical protein GCM10023205_71450 [Yinghuangia aomiensis]|uniref:Uncharacterized protein n=1 Tax=Yinghuangia aomiensis TaxID=676205 RepID=A0ABP9I7X9_9ACTN